MSATVEVSRTTLEAMAEILWHILATQPAVSPHPPDGSHEVGPSAPAHSLRDVMATCAMQGIWASGRRDADDFKQCQGIARLAYHQADCLLSHANHGASAAGSGGRTT